MSVEIMSVSLSDETIERLAQRIAQLAGNGQWPTTQSNPPSSQNPQDAGAPVSGQQGDPWLNSNGGQQARPQPQGQQQGGHNCAHGPMTFVPAGVNRNTNEPYNQYWKCPLQRGAQGRCRNVYQ